MCTCLAFSHIRNFLLPPGNAVHPLKLLVFVAFHTKESDDYLSLLLLRFFLRLQKYKFFRRNSNHIDKLLFVLLAQSICKNKSSVLSVVGSSTIYRFYYIVYQVDSIGNHVKLQNHYFAELFRA